MNWVSLLLMSILALQTYGKQINNVRVSRQNLSEKNVRLDPLLRRALLRALTELEKEAEEKVKAEDIRNVRSEPKNSSGNYVQNSELNTAKEEIQKTADTSYPTPNPNNPTLIGEEVSTNRLDDNVDSTSPATLQNSFFYKTQTSNEADLNTQQESKHSDPTLKPLEVASNLISALDKENESSDNAQKTNDVSSEKKEESDSKKETEKPADNDNEVDIFKAPLVAAFTLHQDSKGTPHSVIPLFRKEPQDNQRQFFDQQFGFFGQQQRQQFPQNQFIPSVTITPLSQSNQFNQPSRFFPSGTSTPSFSSSTIFPPLVSNSILPQSFPSSLIPSQPFQTSTPVPQFRGNPQNFISTISPQRNLAPQTFPSTLLPPQDFNGVSVVQSHNFNFSPTPHTNFASPTVAPPQAFPPISIPPVTLPLQNEPRFSPPIIVPSLQVNSDQSFLQNQEQGIRNQFLIEEKNRQRLLEEQNRQRQIEEQSRQRQIEEQNRQRQIEEQNRQRQIEEQKRQRQLEEQERQRQIEEQNRQRQIEEQKRLRQIEEERQKQFREQNLRQESFSQIRQQRQEQGVDFQRSLGFSFNQNAQSNFNLPLQTPTKAFDFQLQPSQSLAFQNVESRNRINRQEGFGSTGNLGVVNNQDQRNFINSQNQFQPNQILPFFQGPQQYRTISEEHYRNLPLNQFQQPNRFVQFGQQQNNVQEVNKQLQKLLYQSGVATDASGQEDLNIVSKVLALNHERSDTNVDETVLRNERRADDLSETNLGVGEIKHLEVTTELVETQ